MKPTKAELAEAREFLHKMIKPGDVIYTKLVHVSRSGMYRVIDLYVIKDNQPVRISYSAGILLEGYDSNHEGARASGCGMDMGFALVHNLGYILFPNGFDCVGENCPSNDHCNYYNFKKDGGKLPPDTCLDHIERKAGICHNPNCKPWHHQEGGYALSQRWM